MNSPIHILSLGAGVQSSTLALMAAKGEIAPMPSCAIFADTQGEPKNVYEWLDYLELLLPFPVHRVTAGSLLENELKIVRSKRSGNLYRKNKIPAFVLKPDGKKGLLGRQCTMDFKIIPLIKKTRELIGLKRATKTTPVMAKMWIGISIDESHRMKPSRNNFIENIFPLVDRGISRNDCLEWMKKNGYKEPPRSACTFCPFHSDIEWIKLKTDHRKDFDAAVIFERKLIESHKQQEVLLGTPFLHNSCVPLDQVEFKDAEGYQQVSQFGNECEGLCGV